MMTHSSRRVRSAGVAYAGLPRGVVVLVLMAGAWCGLAGCQKPLLSPTEERTQFDRYDAIRNQHAPQYIEDPFGRRHPNLRARLMPRE